MKTIVVPTDFSPVAFNAARYAAALATTMNASLSLLYVCQLPMVYSEVPISMVSIGEMTAAAEINMDRLKKELFSMVDDKIKIYTEIKVGNVLTELKMFCADAKPYAVVMGTHGAGALERFLLGSNTLAAMKHLSWPLIVVPAHAKFSAIRNIGLACDFKKIVRTAPVEEVRNLVKDLNANLHILYIRERPEKEYSPDIIEESGWLQEMLGDLNPQYHFTDNENINEGLLALAESYLLDLLIVVPRKHGLAERIFHPGHTKQLVLHTHIPMMAIHE